MSAATIAESAARQVLVEKFPSMDSSHVYVITANRCNPLVLVYRSGAAPVQ